MAKAKKTVGKDAPGAAATSAAKTAGGAGRRIEGDRLHTAQVRELVSLMVANDLTTLEIVNGDLKVMLGRGGWAPAATAAVLPVAAAAAASLAAPASSNLPADPAAKPAETLLEIKSPMVGTFYAAPSPDSEPYVAVGARVAGDAVVCIIEAMKVMNEIKAECAGALAEVCVRNVQPVEYGQVLFRVRPS